MAITDPDVFLYRVEAGAWEAVVGTDGFTDSGSPSYAGSGDLEYIDLNGTDEWTGVDTVPDLTGFGYDSDWTVAVKFQAPSNTLDERQDILAFSFIGASFRISLKTDGVPQFSTSSPAAITTDADAAFGDATDHVIVIRYNRTSDQVFGSVDGGDWTFFPSPATNDAGIMDDIAIGAEATGPGTSNHFLGRVYWVAGWNIDIGTTERDELDDSDWPFSIPAGGSVIPQIMNHRKQMGVS